MSMLQCTSSGTISFLTKLCTASSRYVADSCHFLLCGELGVKEEGKRTPSYTSVCVWGGREEGGGGERRNADLTRLLLLLLLFPLLPFPPLLSSSLSLRTKKCRPLHQRVRTGDGEEEEEEEEEKGGRASIDTRSRTGNMLKTTTSTSSKRKWTKYRHIVKCLHVTPRHATQQ